MSAAADLFTPNPSESFMTIRPWLPNRTVLSIVSPAPIYQASTLTCRHEGVIQAIAVQRDCDYEEAKAIFVEMMKLVVLATVTGEHLATPSVLCTALRQFFKFEPAVAFLLAALLGRRTLFFYSQDAANEHEVRDTLKFARRHDFDGSTIHEPYWTVFDEEPHLLAVLLPRT